MKISGFTVIRNALLMGYPIEESLRSILPLVDELVIGVGQSEDGTKALIEGLNDSKIRIFDSFWDLNKTRGGLILSEKTNEALTHCKHNWCFYLQADEVLHEKDYENILKAARNSEHNPRIEGLLFGYIHFYGSHKVIATSRKWYRNEIRMIKKDSGVQSYRDAQGFRIEGRRVQVAKAHAQIYHYGWVKPPSQMGVKTKLLNRLWHGNKRDSHFDHFQYDRAYGLRYFKGTHPQVMMNRVAKQDWEFDPTRTLKDWTLKDLRLWSSDLIERGFGWRIGEYKPFKLIKN